MSRAATEAHERRHTKNIDVTDDRARASDNEENEDEEERSVNEPGNVRDFKKRTTAERDLERSDTLSDFIAPDDEETTTHRASKRHKRSKSSDDSSEPSVDSEWSAAAEFRGIESDESSDVVSAESNSSSSGSDNSTSSDGDKDIDDVVIGNHEASDDDEAPLASPTVAEAVAAVRSNDRRVAVALQRATSSSIDNLPMPMTNECLCVDSVEASLAATTLRAAVVHGQPFADFEQFMLVPRSLWPHTAFMRTHVRQLYGAMLGIGGSGRSVRLEMLWRLALANRLDRTMQSSAALKARVTAPSRATCGLCARPRCAVAATFTLDLRGLSRKSPYVRARLGEFIVAGSRCAERFASIVDALAVINQAHTWCQEMLARDADDNDSATLQTLYIGVDGAINAAMRRVGK